MVEENDVTNELIDRLDSLCPDLQEAYELLLEDGDTVGIDELTLYLVREVCACSRGTHDPDVAQRHFTDRLRDVRMELSSIISNL